ncbi:MAG: thioredoxin domain-containing protein [Myxococcota bacterium]
MLQLDDVEQLSRYVAGELDAPQRAQVEARLARDAEFAAALRQLAALDEVTARLAAAPVEPEAVVNRAIARAVRPRWRVRWPLFVALAAAAALVVALRSRDGEVPPEVRRVTTVRAGVQVLPGTDHVEEGEHVSRLRGGTALYTGDWLVITPERTLEVHGRALITTNPSDALSHVTDLATPTPEESDMIRRATTQFSLGASLAVLVFSGVVQADQPIHAGEAWRAKSKAPLAPQQATAPQPVAEPKKEECQTCTGGEEELGPPQDVKVGSSPTLGPADAKLTVVLFSEAECPFCVQSHGVLRELEKAYAGKVRFVFKHFPLPRHAGARQAAVALHAAHAQGRFWEMVESAYGSPVSTESGLYDAQARALGLDLQQYRRDVASPQTAAVIDADIAEGQRLGVQGVPAWFINGRQLKGHRNLETMRRLLDAELAKPR